MTAIRNFALAARRAPLCATALRSRAAFSTSAARFAGKEDRLNVDGRSEEAEAHKEDLLKKQKEGKGHWKDELASNSESIIKAERGEIDASEETIKKLQEESAKVSQEQK